MKSIFKIISLILIMVLCSTCTPITSLAAEAPHVCKSYEECTENGEIYIITKNDCPIRKEPNNNKNNIVTRGKRGQLISVSKTFRTIKGSRWCEIQLSESEKKLYIHVDNCERHIHSYMTLVSNNNGKIDFCAICGFAVAEGTNQHATCDFKCVSDQAIKGSFSEYNPSFASILAQIIVGEVAGPFADGRDLVGDIINGEPGWVIATDLAAFLPLIGALKYSDELAILGRTSDDFAVVTKNSKSILWGKWNDYSKVTLNGKEYAEIGDFYYTKHAVEEFLNPSIETNQIKNIEHSRGVPPSFVNWILTKGMENGTTKIVGTTVENGIERVRYSNGTLDVIVENGNIIVTIITK